MRLPDEFPQREGSERKPPNRASTPRLEIGSPALFGKSQQHPIAVWAPLLFEILARNSEKFPTSRVVDENGFTLPINARHYDIMQRGFGTTRLETHNQRAASFEVLQKFAPVSVEGKHAKT